MKVNEAIEAIIQDSSLWARPLWWRGSGLALNVFFTNRVSVVPSLCGGAQWHVAVRDLMDDWELVDPNTVLDEV